MEEKIFKKLEKISFSQIELPSHKEKLKKFLLEKYFPEKKKQERFLFFRKIVFCIVSLIFLFFFTFSFIYPQYVLAKAKKIAFLNPEVKKFIEEGGKFKEIKVYKKEGYVLVTPPQGEFFKRNHQKIIGVLIRVDLKNKKIPEIKKITPDYFIGEKEIEEAKEIIHQLKDFGKEPPLILKIEEIPLELRLIEEEERIKVLPLQKKINVIYKAGEKIWEGKVNLDQNILEIAKPFEEE